MYNLLPLDFRILRRYHFSGESRQKFILLSIGKHSQKQNVLGKFFNIVSSDECEETNM